MRPNQQNNNNKNRQRSRNNNGGRKHINPLSRNFESNGPDVKVRGNAAHVAEKYLQLARDAQSSGDSVMAENYLQHAEHYNRIVMAAQPQNQPRFDQFGQQIASDQQQSDDDDFPPVYDRFASPEPRQPDPPLQRQDGQPMNAPAPAPQESLSGDTVVIQATPAAAENDQQQDAAAPAPVGEDGEPRHRRDRQRRRRRTFDGPGGQGADPGAAPQPDVGELPAFLTAGTTTNAAE
jgi:Domain of unknown function (DUF4167)